jgi:hypothetical protein
MKKVRDARRRPEPVASSPWIGGRFAAPLTIRSPEGAYRPEIVVWMRDGAVISQDITKPETVLEALVATFQQAVQAAGAPPSRVRVAVEAFADAVRPLAGDAAKVEVAPTPEIERLREIFLDNVDKLPGGESPTYTSRGAVSPATVEALFRSAARLYRLKPWEIVSSDDETVRLDCALFGWEGACVSIMGGLGQEFGFMLFNSGADYTAFRAFGTQNLDAGAPRLPPTEFVSLNFEKKRDLPEGMAREADRHRWPVAGPGAYPWVISMDVEGPRPTTARDMVRVRVAAETLARFFERHGDAWDDVLDGDEPTTERYVFDDIPGRPEVIVSAPHDVWRERHGEGPWLDEYVETLIEAGAAEDSPAVELAEGMGDAVIEAIDEYGAPPLVDWDESDVDQLLLVMMPRKLSWTRAQCEGGASALAGWLRWLGQTGRLELGEALARHAASLDAAFVRAMTDPKNYGLAKSVFAQMENLGMPLNTEDEINAAVVKYNELLAWGEVEPPNLPGLPQAGDPAVMRGAPSVGRNDLCFCGSGKKYKKCHGA